MANPVKEEGVVTSEGTVVARLADGSKNRAVRWSLANYFVLAASGPLAALLVAAQLDPVTQGYYYTFSSLLALQVFLELGFSVCVTQFAAHEFARLHFASDKTLEGDGRALNRFLSIGRLAQRWYAVAALLALAGLVCAGEVMFGSRTDGVDWRGGWYLLCVATTLNLALLPLPALLEGCNEVAAMAKARTAQNFARAGLLLFLLGFSPSLYAAGFAALLGFVILAMQLLRDWHGLLRQVLAARPAETISWRREIWPMQWRISVSWISGYLIFSSFVPTLFSSVGPEAAGQFGLSWSLLQGVSTVGLVFVTTQQPLFGTLTGRGEWAQLRDTWHRALSRALIVTAVGAVAIVVLVASVEHFAIFRQRILPTLVVLPLALALVPTCFTAAVASLARAEKREPFLVQSLVTGLLVVLGNLLLAPRVGAWGVACNYLFWTAAGAVWARTILRRTAAFCA